MSQGSSFTPLVLLVEDQEWTARSLESMLAPSGYAVFKAFTGRQGLEILSKMIPDVILLGHRLPDMSGSDLLRRLDHVPTVFPSTPRLVVTPGRLTDADRMDVFEAGAWDIFDPPFQPRDIVARLANWVRAKRDADDARDRGLVDLQTGLYNFNGVLRRIDEIVSDAARAERFVSFVMVGPNPTEDGGPSGLDQDRRGDVARQLGRTLASTLRLSDAAGRVGHTEFVVVAPGTDAEGAATLARRVLDALRGDDEGTPLPLRAGVYSVRRSHREAFSSLDLLGRATEALRRAHAPGGADADGIGSDRLN